VSVREAILAADADAVEAALIPDVVWVGARPGWLCRNREQVMEVVRGALERSAARPEIVAETAFADSDEVLLVVDPHLEPPSEQVPGVHQVFVLHEEHIVEIRDYPDRASALAAVAG
jgi:ketosteroid isomerase-like protein